MTQAQRMNWVYFCCFGFLFCLNCEVVDAQTTSRKARKYYENAKSFQVGREWDKAIAEYQKALGVDPDFPEALLALATMYELNFQPNKSRELYQKLAKLKPDDPEYLIAHSKLAGIALQNGEYEKALASAEKFLSFNPSMRFKKEIDAANQTVKISKYALEGLKKPLDFNPKELNKEFHVLDQQYFPVLTADQERMIFTGRDATTDEQIYVSEFEKGKWSSPKPIKELNTPFNEGTTSISADGAVMVFTACESYQERSVYGSCDLFITYKKGDSWEPPKNLGRKVNTRNWESQPALSADGRRLFFVSDRPGGLGKRDIWMTELDENNRWKDAVNLGDSINSADDEISPFLHVNGKTLFFSSLSHDTFGGFDIFKSEWKEGKWQAPKNIGYPINNHKDQVGLFITSDGKKAYYSDERPVNGKVISRVLVSDIPPEIEIQTISGFVKGKVFDEKSGRPLQAIIQLKDVNTQETISQVTSDAENGKFLMVLNQGAQYALHASVKGYVFKSLSFDYQDKMQESGVIVNLPMQPIEKGSSVRLNNIFFDFDSFDLLESSGAELQTVKWFLERHPQVKIEIAGYTDNAGSEEYNLQLSEKRANSVMEYLIKNGIPSSQVSAKGYGSANPVAENETEEGRAQNRRIEFKIL